MKFQVDLSLFEGQPHTPTLLQIGRKLTAGKSHDLVDFCVPVNSYFPTPEFRAQILAQLDRMLKYYPASNRDIATCLSEFIGVAPECLVMGNGSNELITWIDHLFVHQSLLVDVPTFGRWTDQPHETGKQVHLYRREESRNFQIDIPAFVELFRERGTRVAVISNPSNPTGAILSKPELLKWVQALENTDRVDLIIVDESFIDFSVANESEIPTLAGEASKNPKLIVLKSLGKNLGMHGIRLGYAVAHPKTAALLRDRIPRWNVNGLAELVLRELVDAKDDYEASRRLAIRDRDHLYAQLSKIRTLKVFPSSANFVYVRLPDGVNGVDLRNRLLESNGLLIRECGSKLGSTSQFLRIASRPEKEANLLVTALKQHLDVQ